MFQLIQPIWLIAMTGIAVPVIVHLWNDRPGKVLSIGSIALLEKDTQQQSRSRRLSEWLLLLLRCLLLLFLALLLCGPFWKRNPRRGVKGWVLVEKGGWGDSGINAGSGARKNAGTADVLRVDDDNPYKPLIDSLVRTGYELHSLGAENEVARPDDRRMSYWTLFEQADRQGPAGIPFYVFTSGKLNRFSGRRPVTKRPVHWYTYPPGDRVGDWIEAAWLNAPDSIRVLTGSSRSTGSSYSYQELSARTAVMQGGAYHVGVVDGRFAVALDSQPPIMGDTTALRISIFADHQYSRDSRYLAAAIRAWQEFTRRNVRLSITDRVQDAIQGTGMSGAGMGGAAVSGMGKGGKEVNRNEINGADHRTDWLFWLSSQPVPSGDSVANILVYERGREAPVDTWVQEGAGAGGGIAGKAELARVIVSGNEDLRPVWEDGFGRPVLACERHSGSRIFHFYSRFDPAWNGLVWSPTFPILLQDLLVGRRADPAEHDSRVLDPEQVAPLENHGTEDKGDPAGVLSGDLSERATLPSVAIDLAPVCWVIIFLLLLAERLISYRLPRADRPKVRKDDRHGSIGPLSTDRGGSTNSSRKTESYG